MLRDVSEGGAGLVGGPVGSSLVVTGVVSPPEGGVIRQFRQCFPPRMIFVWETLGNFRQVYPPLLHVVCEGGGSGMVGGTGGHSLVPGRKAPPSGEGGAAEILLRVHPRGGRRPLFPTKKFLEVPPLGMRVLSEGGGVGHGLGQLSLNPRPPGCLGGLKIFPAPPPPSEWRCELRGGGAKFLRREGKAST